MGIRACLDCGFSANKFAVLENGVLRYNKELNSICNLGKENYDAYTGKEKSIVEFQGSHYLVGKSSLQMKDATIQRIADYETMRMITPIIATYYLKNYNPEDVESLCFTLSSAYLDKSQDYFEHLEETLPQFKGKISLVPQGASVKKCVDAIGLDVDNPSYKDSYKSYIICDIGFNTIDVANVIDGSLMPNDIKGYEHTGAVLIAEEVQKQIKSKFGIDLPLPRVKPILEDKSFKIRADTYDCTDIVQNATELYLEVLRDFLETNYKDEMNAISNVLVVGGGGELIRNNEHIWEEYYGEGFMILPKVPGTAEYFNAIGGLY